MLAFDMGTLSEISGCTDFNGAAVIKADLVGNPKRIVVSNIEYNQVNTNASAVEGVADFDTATTLWMPSALCNFNGTSTTNYAIQNTDTTNFTNITIQYYDLSGNAAASQLFNNLGPGKKLDPSPSGCDVLPSGFIGSAKITSSGGIKIAAIGKVTGAGAATNFLAQRVGFSKLYLPYQRWATDAEYTAGRRQRSYNAFQNIGPSPLLLNTVCVKFYDTNGAQQGNTICNDGLNGRPAALATGQKFNVHPVDAGVGQGSYGFGWDSLGNENGGGATVEGPAGSQLIAVTRITTFNSATDAPAEDYVGQP